MPAPKTIVFCADGTWNGLPPEKPEYQKVADPKASDTTPELGEGLVGCTNVYRLFHCLEGGLVSDPTTKKEQEKVFGDPGNPSQVAKYIHGVGDSTSVVDKFAGGAFGIGVVARIARGYTYISRHYNPGDAIVIVGFSRGAYTARALGGLISTMGLLKPELATSPDDKYQNAVAAWYKYRERRNANALQKVLDFLTKIHNLGLDLDRKDLDQNSFVDPVEIQAVAVWDTVGSLGFPIADLEVRGATKDIFQFTDNSLSDRVRFGLHALSIDEKRPPFTPTTWRKRDNVVQRLFAGAHSDVGGGYTEHGLADISLKWMIEQLQQNGQLQLNSAKVATITPNPLDVAHKPWAKPLYEVLNPQDRNFSDLEDVEVDPSVLDRMAADGVAHEPGQPPEPYKPQNIARWLASRG
jgi:uncharacterized protein (DUF2235 family)